MAETAKTNLRIPPALKAAAAAKARLEYRTLTDVVVAALAGYVAAPGAGGAPVEAVPRECSGASACPHPKARVLKGLCGACGSHVGSR